MLGDTGSRVLNPAIYDPVRNRIVCGTDLARLQTDYLDIYMLHRDNPSLPAGAFIEALNAELRAGRVRAFGASNWSIERVEEANRYAQERGLVGFAAMSNNFSLARMVEPVWAGCIAASDPESRAWLTERQLPLMPWSSQARGFFTGRAAPDRRDDPELVRCWYSPDNFARLERVNALRRHIVHARHPQDLWHLRTAIYTEVARAFDQAEAEARLLMLNRQLEQGKSLLRRLLG